jgi:hypothetical protein
LSGGKRASLFSPEANRHKKKFYGIGYNREKELCIASARACSECTAFNVRLREKYFSLKEKIKKSKIDTFQ